MTTIAALKIIGYWPTVIDRLFFSPGICTSLQLQFLMT